MNTRTLQPLLHVGKCQMLLLRAVGVPSTSHTLLTLTGSITPELQFEIVVSILSAAHPGILFLYACILNMQIDVTRKTVRDK